ncbi:hypothetical protein BDZ94DRAFT_1249472 [Collybia nuda]|uniref:Uncharacterized protein n=1 Tax=Collybia nuda TaxID=64659 RepID=A0A9P5YEM7_9AGAR|nr:hypothetical protein BDZ94DRAFT_1249472 [Collybia nuda]
MRVRGSGVGVRVGFVGFKSASDVVVDMGFEEADVVEDVKEGPDTMFELEEIRPEFTVDVEVETEVDTDTDTETGHPLDDDKLDTPEYTDDGPDLVSPLLPAPPLALAARYRSISTSTCPSTDLAFVFSFSFPFILHLPTSIPLPTILYPPPPSTLTILTCAPVRGAALANGSRRSVKSCVSDSASLRPASRSRSIPHSALVKVPSISGGQTNARPYAGSVCRGV